MRPETKSGNAFSFDNADIFSYFFAITFPVSHGKHSGSVLAGILAGLCKKACFFACPRSFSRGDSIKEHPSIMADPLRPSITPLSRPGGPGVPGGMLGELQSEVSVEATPLLRFVLDHIRAIVTIVVLAVVVAAAAGVWHWHSARSEREAQLEFGRILVTPATRERLEALEGFLQAAPSSMKLGVQLEIAAAAAALGDTSKAAQAYAAVCAADPQGALGIMAGLNEADVLLRAGRPEEALARLDALMASAPATLLDPVRQAVREGQAAAAEQAGRLERALEAYEAIVKNSGLDELGYYQAKIVELKARMAQSAAQQATHQGQNS